MMKCERLLYVKLRSSGTWRRVRLYICMLFGLVLFSFLLSSAFILALTRFYHLAVVPIKQLLPNKFVAHFYHFLHICLLHIVINFIYCICLLLLFVPSTGVYFHMLSFVNTNFPILPSVAPCCRFAIATHRHLLVPIAFCYHLFTTVIIPDVPPLSAQSWHQTRTLRDEKACYLYVQCQWSLTPPNCKWALVPNNRATHRSVAVADCSLVSRIRV